MKIVLILFSALFLMNCSQFGEPQTLTNPPAEIVKAADVLEEPPVPEPAVVDYAFIKAQILDNKCTSCHKVGGSADELVFETREQTLALWNSYSQPMVVIGKPEESLMYLSVIKEANTKAMPPKKAIASGKVKDITAQEINWIKIWITEGAK